MHVIVLNDFMGAAGEPEARSNSITFLVSHSPVLAVLITGRCHGGAAGGDGEGDTGEGEMDSDEPLTCPFFHN